jgi:tetratricopeptide (TPR) repeat protein
MSTSLAKRREKEERIRQYLDAANAIEELKGIDRIVSEEVEALINRLSSETVALKQELYLPAVIGAPMVVDTDVTADGRLGFQAESQGTRAPAHHVSNASDLRATLLAFVLAFWKELLRSRGGLSLLLLDDVDEMFDRENIRRLANTIPSLVAKSARPILTTNDLDFARRVGRAARNSLESDSLDYRRIHPLNPARAHIELGRFLEAIEAKEKEFQSPENQNEDGPAREYLKELRIYLENRLLDLFEIPQALPDKPTLTDILQSIRRRVRQGNEAFQSRTFRTLVDDESLREGSNFLELINESHHGRDNEITFGAVYAMRGDCRRVRELVDAAHEEYERWIQRDTRDSPEPMPDAPETWHVPEVAAPIVGDLAAFCSGDAVAVGEIADESVFDQSRLGRCAIFAIHSNNFGFAAPRLSRAIVDLEEDPEDRRLVIAFHRDRVYARRLLRDASNPGHVALGSETVNPLDRPPSLLLRAAETRLLKVKGVLFDSREIYPRPKGEAVVEEHSAVLERVEVVFRVHGDSATPLALPGQSVLGGRQLLPIDLPSAIGEFVAIATTDGAYLKRVGGPVDGWDGIFRFESIGGHGDSLLVHTEVVDGNDDPLPILVSAREVIGVFYDPL